MSYAFLTTGTPFLKYFWVLELLVYKNVTRSSAANVTELYATNPTFNICSSYIRYIFVVHILYIITKTLPEPCSNNVTIIINILKY